MSSPSSTPGKSPNKRSSSSSSGSSSSSSSCSSSGNGTSNPPALARQHAKKHWSKEYIDRITEAHNQEAYMRKKKYSNQISAASRLRFAKTVIAKIRAKMAHRGYSCKKTLDNIKPPTMPQVWENSWSTQNLCFLCNTPSISESIHCKICDTVAHYNCIIFSEKEAYKDAEDDLTTMDNEDMTGIHESEAGNFEFQCEECNEITIAEKQLYKDNFIKLKSERDLKRSAMLIFAFCKTYIERRKFFKKRRALLLLQSCIRRRLANRKYNASRRAMMRVIVFEFPFIPNLNEYSLVVITVLDTIKHSQIFRFDKYGTSALTEAIIVPGINAYMTLVVTVCSRKENSVETKNNPYTYFADFQATFALRDISKFMDTDKFHINLTDKIRWHVQESSHEDAHVVNSALSVNEYVDVKKYQKKELPKEKLVIKYSPQNPMSSLCYQVQAVPLDALKRSADMSVRKAANNPNALSRTTKWWLCLYNLKVFFFQFYGDARPRFTGDITSASCHCMKEYSLKHNVPIIHPDGRKWLVEFFDVGDASKFEFAVNESQKAFKEVKGSIFIKSENLHQQCKDFGHNLPMY